MSPRPDDASVAGADDAPSWDVRVTVVRQEPDGEPHEQEHVVACTERTTVLDALDAVKEQDASVTYRWSCRMGVCGSCGVMVNGRPVLACETPVLGYRATGLTLAPLARHAVLRDLVVDTDRLVGQLADVRAWLVAAPDGPGSDEPGPTTGAGRQTPAELNTYRGLAQCIDCMLCYAACPQIDLLPDFLGPAAVAAARRWDLDPRDHGDVLRRAVLDTEDGIWGCVQSGACTRACPKGVDPAKALRDAQREAMG
ncbi:succinate dehydrogenase/fumarate reductase iron-sulfur subunit [Luteimicrobium subarcticum]|uniref:succinate dehydrogenase n=1 Tax=Luteimicrobium subarcticum TaxID=620910 RepID=A0A2M8WR64_9MICO|nr:succinate dehydrogenase/fumarate reductase iron-sulfur subunit [Luteimicrobium subarcticum]PJI93430.1 succinate dehydrogenase subunit B [Luteimicrobium subarcticum]